MRLKRGTSDAAGEQAAVDVGERLRPARRGRCRLVLRLARVMARNTSPITSCVLARPLAHLVDRGGEQVVAVEDVGDLGEEAEDQPRHEVVHVGPALGRVPVRVVLQQLDIEPVEPARRADVEGVLADLLDGGDAGQRQEEAEMVGKSA